MSKTFRVALALREGHLSSARALLVGVHRFAHTRHDWEFVRQKGSLVLSWKDALAAKPDGILVFLNREWLMKIGRSGRSRVVVLNPETTPFPVRRVTADHEKCGWLTAQHLIRQYLGSFANVANSEVSFAALQRRGFEKALAAESFPVPVPSVDIRQKGSDLGAWLAGLPRPCGILCAYTELAAKVVRTCQQRGWNVPADISLITVTNDELACVESPTPLTSVTPNHEIIGFQAAAYLDQWLRGDPPRTHHVLISPGEVVARESTRTFGVADPLVRRALMLIDRDRAGTLNVDTLLRELGNPSRRLLERAFRRAVGRSPYQEMLHRRIARAQHLILSTTRTIEDVAAAGFSTAAQFHQHFRRIAGVTPAGYRTIQRQSANPHW